MPHANSKTQKHQPAQALHLEIVQIQNIKQFQQYAPGIQDLLRGYQHVLLDDFSGIHPEQLLHNTSTYLPWLWLLVHDSKHYSQPPTETSKHSERTDDSQSISPEQELAIQHTIEPGAESTKVYGLACLSPIIPGRHAYVHGVSHPAIRKHPAVRQLGEWVLQVAFQQLGVRKVKAEIEANNPGAQGYCRRLGFVREAHFKQDNRLNGEWVDVLVYSLFAEQFQSRVKLG